MLDRLLRGFRGRAPSSRSPASQTPRDSETLRRLLEVSPLPMALVTAAGEIDFLNQRFLETFGYDRAELPNLDAWWVRAYPNTDDRTRLQRQWCERMLEVAGKGGNFPVHETEVTCRDGTVRAIEWRATHVDRVTLVIGTDMTERRAASRALAASEERYRILLEHAPEAVVVLDVDIGRFMEANPSAERLFKLTREQLLQSGLNELCPPQQADGRTSSEASRLLIQAALDGRTSVAEWTCRDRQDNDIPCEIQMLRLPDAAGRRLVRGSIIDIRRRREADEVRKQLEAQLRQAQKMEAIGTLAGGIAHDFNNILTGILGSVELAQHELAPDDSARPMLDRATRACLRARDLVSKILTFSRRGEPQRSIHLLGPVVRESSELLRASLPATIEIRTFFTPEPVPVLCDPGQMQQVVMNLSANAAHAMRSRGGILTIALEVQPLTQAFLSSHPSFPPGDVAVLTVTDTGMGMDVATKERIFEPFFTTKPIGEGTGLGLAVVHGIIEDHGGVITVESELNVGTTFRVVLPVTATGTLRHSASPFDLPHGAGQRLLLVDDENDVVAVGSKALAKIGYKPTAFTRPGDALAAFRAAPDTFDALVTDLTMPDIPGADLVAEIRDLRPSLPVLVLTGYLRGAEHERMRSLGVAHFLTKPFSLDSLAKAMQDLFGNSN